VAVDGAASLARRGEGNAVLHGLARVRPPHKTRTPRLGPVPPGRTQQPLRAGDDEAPPAVGDRARPGLRYARLDAPISSTRNTGWSLGSGSLVKHGSTVRPQTFR